MVVFLVASIGTYMLLFGHAAPADSSQPFLRYYDSTTAAHLYLRQSNPPNDPTDWAPDRASDYSFEFTIGYILPTQTNGSIPLYRLYSYNNGDNFYTADYSQAVLAQQSYGYKYVGVEGYVQPSKITSTKPLYRLYLPWGTHFYTTIATERDSSVSNGATYEGIEGYLYNQAGLGGTPAPTPTPTPTPTPAPAPTPTPAPTPSGGGSTTTIKTTRSPTPAPLQTTSSDSGTADLSVGTSTSDGTNTGTSGSDSQDSSGGSSPSQATTTTGTQAKAKKTSSAGGWILTALLALLMIGALVVLRLRNRNVAPAIDEDMVSPLPPAQPPVIPEAPAPASSSPMHLPPPPKAGNIWQEKINEAFYPNQPHPNSGANQKSDEPLDMFELAQQDPKNFGHDASADSAQPAQPAPPPPPKPSAPKVTPQARPATRPKHVPRLPHEHNPKLPAEETVVKLHKHDS